MVSEVMASLHNSFEFLERALMQIQQHRMPNKHVTAGIYVKQR